MRTPSPCAAIRRDAREKACVPARPVCGTAANSKERKRFRRAEAVVRTMYELNDKIRDLEPYEPIAGDYKIRLDANESFLYLPESVMASALHSMFSVELNRYPDPTAKALCEAFARAYGVEPAHVAAGNGSDELISVIFQSFLQKGDVYATIAPDFSMYDFYGYIAECRGVAIPKRDDWTIDVDKVIETCNNEGVKLLIFSNPCNPTSLGLDREAVRRIVSGVSALVVLDEAYMDFWDEPMLPEAAAYDNLLVLKTCSKAFGLAALRVGFAVGSEKLIRAIKAVKSPYNVNAISQRMAEVVLKSRGECGAATRRILLSRDELQAGLERIAGQFAGQMEVVPSVTNFVVVRTLQAEALFKKLLSVSIAVRYFKNLSALRITAGSTSENAAVLDHIRRFFEANHEA